VTFGYIGEKPSGGIYASTHYSFLLSQYSIAKYSLTPNTNDDPISYVLNKDIEIMLSGDSIGLLRDPDSLNYEFSLQIVCKCSSPQVVNFVCFYGTDGCNFVVENI
jgi:hypothetical protein